MQKKTTPLTDIEKWVNRHVWLDGADLRTELRQATDEGIDLGPLRKRFDQLLAVPPPDESWHQHLGGGRDEAWLEAATELVDAVSERPLRSDYPYDEPSDLPSIRKASDAGTKPRRLKPLSKSAFAKKLHGGLLGRICGCMLGKPVEGWPREDIQTTAAATGNWPLAAYFSKPSPAAARKIAAAKPKRQLHLHWTSVILPTIDGMVEDDDINYTTIGFAVLKQFGADFTPADVASYWCTNLPVFRTCTAERVAYRNFLVNILPPFSAVVRNPYREWIGAQIRADYFGYANPGNPLRAAEWAWRDASISHVKNGIYGEMWVAAMLAIAYHAPKGDWRYVIEEGLRYIPAQSRLAADVRMILELHAEGVGAEQAVDAVHVQWDQTSHHDWCHTNSNAQVVAIALLWGEDDYTKTIGTAVGAGFDTDCNGATAGSLWGVMHGVDAIPSQWTGPIKDRVRTGVTEYRDVPISTLAGEMAQLALKLK